MRTPPRHTEALAAIALAIFARGAAAATLHVPGDHPTIQAAIAAASDGDTILVAPGVYNEALDLLGKQLVIEGASGAGATILDGLGLGTSIVTAASGEPIDTTFRGFTFTRGEGTLDTRCLTGFVGTALFGGAAFIVSSGMTFESCLFEDNGNGSSPMDRGGGCIYLDVADVRVQGCTFRHNGTSVAPGVGFYSGATLFTCTSGGTLKVEDSLFEQNGHPVIASVVNVRGIADVEVLRCQFRENEGGGAGGALLVQTGTDTSPGFAGSIGTSLVKDCVFARNVANWGGAARIVSNQEGVAVVEDCTFLDNEGTGGGAASLVASYGNLTAVPPVLLLRRCLFARNSATGSGTAVTGGGLHAIVTEGGLLEVTDSVFVGNDAGYRGGALSGHVSDGLLRVANCTMVDNSAANNAGGVAFTSGEGGQLEVVSSVLRGNTGPVQYIGDLHSSIRYSNVEGGASGPGNIDVDAQFLAPPSDGGDGWGDEPSTPGIDESLNDDFGDLRIAPTSPCIDAGDTTVLASPGAALDFGGLQRAPNDPGTLDTGLTSLFVFAVDIGAHDFQGKWVDLGGGTAGAAGAPALVGSGFLVPTLKTEVHLSQAPPSSAALVWVSFQSIPVPFAGGTIHAFPPIAQVLTQADGDGGLVVSAPWPSGLPGGAGVWFQALIQDSSVAPGVVLSNALKATTP